MTMRTRSRRPSVQTTGGSALGAISVSRAAPEDPGTSRLAGRTPELLLVRLHVLV